MTTIFLLILWSSFPWLFPQTSYLSLPSRGLCAHRGAMATFPENTLPAIREAVRLGVAMIELDARMTADSVIVLLHDATVNRTTNGSGKLRTLTLEEVKQLDAGSWKGACFSGTRIPTLAESLAVIPSGIWINVHVKEGPVVSQKAAEVIYLQHKEAQAFLACDTASASFVRRRFPEIMICNMERQADTKDYVRLTLNTHSDFIQFFHTPINDTLRICCERLKEAGIRINYYRGENAEEVRQLWKLGVDFVLVNDPAAIMKEMKESLSAPLF